MTWLTFTLTALATYRIVRLIQRDTIFQKPRNWIEHSPLAKLVSCPWCLTVWAAAATYSAWRFAPDVWNPAATILAISAAAALLLRIDAEYL